MIFLNYKIIGAPKKFKNQLRPLDRPGSVNFCQNFWNLSHETVPLNLSSKIKINWPLHNVHPKVRAKTSLKNLTSFKDCFCTEHFWLRWLFRSKRILKSALKYRFFGAHQKKVKLIYPFPVRKKLNFVHPFSLLVNKNSTRKTIMITLFFEQQKIFQIFLSLHPNLPKYVR